MKGKRGSFGGSTEPGELIAEIVAREAWEEINSIAENSKSSGAHLGKDYSRKVENGDERHAAAIVHIIKDPSGMSTTNDGELEVSERPRLEETLKNTLLIYCSATDDHKNGPQK